MYDSFQGNIIIKVKQETYTKQPHFSKSINLDSKQHSETPPFPDATHLKKMNIHSNAYTIHHCQSPMTLHHAHQSHTCQQNDLPAYDWVAAVMTIYLSAELPFSSDYFHACFTPKFSNWGNSLSHFPFKQRAFFMVMEPGVCVYIYIYSNTMCVRISPWSLEVR